MGLALRSILALVGCLVLAPAAGAQTIYFEDFTNSAPGWSLSSSCCCGVEWNVDALPATVPNGAFRSPPSSLNFNNDVDHDGHQCTGRATTPPIDLTGSVAPTLVFWCNNQSAEANCDTHEEQRVFIDSPLSYLECFGGSILQRLCQFDQWHAHQVPLPPNAGTIRLRFEFYSDGLFDMGPGWFVDDVGVFDVPAPTPYCSATSASTCDTVVDWGGALASATNPRRCWITCSHLPPQSVGLLFYGTNGRATLPFPDGTLCLRPPLRRTIAQSTGGIGLCRGYMELDLNELIQSGSDPSLVAGQQVHAQWWYRDTSLPSGAGLSEAVTLTIQP